MPLVNVSLKTLTIKNGIYANIFAEKNVSSICICKSYSHFFSKNTCEFDIVLTRTVNILTTNELVKLTTLWTTGPWPLQDDSSAKMLVIIFQAITDKKDMSLS